MPQRSNAFQKLVFLINGSLQESGEAVESALLTDKVTGEKSSVYLCGNENNKKLLPPPVESKAKKAIIVETDDPIYNRNFGKERSFSRTNFTSIDL